MRKIEYPPNPLVWVGLPDEWLGEHAQKRDEAVEKSSARGWGTTLRQLAVSLAILDDWRIPGLEGNPEQWDFERLPLPIIGWLNDVVLSDFLECFKIPKNSSSPSPDG